MTDVYRRGDINIEIRDGHANLAYRYTDEEKRVLRSIFDALPEDHLRQLKYVGTSTCSGLSECTGIASFSGAAISHYVQFQSGSSPSRTISSTETYTAPTSKPLQTNSTTVGGLSGFAGTTFHEIGHSVHFAAIPADEKSEWELLNSNSTNPSDFFSDYGATHINEDFATVYAALTDHHREYHLLSALDNIQRNGRGLLLQKYLFMMSLFDNSASRRIEWAAFDTVGNTVLKNPYSYIRNGQVLTLRNDCACRSDFGYNLPLQIQLTLNGSNEITRIEFTDARAALPNPIRKVINLSQPIRLPATTLKRMRF